jgi:hypothetical protein
LNFADFTPRLISDPGSRFFVILPFRVSVKWSGRRDSNPRPSPWQGDALSAELLPRKMLPTTQNNKWLE